MSLLLNNFKVNEEDWADLILDTGLILNQNRPNFTPIEEGSISLRVENILIEPKLAITKLYLCPKTANILVEVFEKDSSSSFHLILGKVPHPTLLTGRVLGDLICASSEYRKEGHVLRLVPKDTE